MANTNSHTHYRILIKKEEKTYKDEKKNANKYLIHQI